MTTLLSESIPSTYPKQDDELNFFLATWPDKKRRDVIVRLCGASYKISGTPLFCWLNNILSKLSEFSEFESDWDGYGAKKINIVNIISAIHLITAIASENTLEPYVVPTTNGGIQFEWHTENIDLEIEIVEPSKILVLLEIGDEECDWELSSHEARIKLSSLLENFNW